MTRLEFLQECHKQTRWPQAVPDGAGYIQGFAEGRVEFLRLVLAILPEDVLIGVPATHILLSKEGARDALKILTKGRHKYADVNSDVTGDSVGYLFDNRAQAQLYSELTEVLGES